MSRVSSEYITPENFGDYFLQGEPERIYNQCIKDFQKIVTLNQFKELVHSFNQNQDFFDASRIDRVDCGLMNGTYFSVVFVGVLYSSLVNNHSLLGEVDRRHFPIIPYRHQVRDST